MTKDTLLSTMAPYWWPLQAGHAAHEGILFVSEHTGNFHPGATENRIQRLPNILIAAEVQHAAIVRQEARSACTQCEFEECIQGCRGHQGGAAGRSMGAWLSARTG